MFWCHHTRWACPWGFTQVVLLLSCNANDVYIGLADCRLQHSIIRKLLGRLVLGDWAIPIGVQSPGCYFTGCAPTEWPVDGVAAFKSQYMLRFFHSLVAMSRYLKQFNCMNNVSCDRNAACMRTLSLQPDLWTFTFPQTGWPTTLSNSSWYADRMEISSRNVFS